LTGCSLAANVFSEQLETDMADSRRIDGTVKAQPDVAQVAYQMALDLWQNSGKPLPTIADDEFVRLVSSCAKALQGNYSNYSFVDAL
jgi:hypothetical protein